MPTYSYVCDECSNRWEAQQRITEDALKKCPKCGKNKARREIISGNFILKGGGWYADLYSSTSRSSAPPAADASPTSTAPKAVEATSETKTETKSEVKAETKAESKPAKKAAKKA